jgi:hypothetical protein
MLILIAIIKIDEGVRPAKPLLTKHQFPVKALIKNSSTFKITFLYSNGPGINLNVGS